MEGMEAGVVIKHLEGKYHVKMYYSGDLTIGGFQVTLGVRETPAEALALLYWFIQQLAEDRITWHEWKKEGLRNAKGNPEDGNL